MNRDKYLSEVENITAGETFKEQTKQLLMREIGKKNVNERPLTTKKIVGAVASVCLILGLTWLITSLIESEQTETLPLLTIHENLYLEMGAHGGGGVMLAYQVDELIYGNPWDEEVNLNTLPVYKNKAQRDPAGLPKEGLSQEAMLERAEDVAAALNSTVCSTEKQDFGIIAEGEHFQVNIEKTGNVTVYFDEPITVPGLSEFKDSKDEDEKYSYEVILDDLLLKYSELVGMESPGHDIGYDYSIDGEKKWNISAYEAAGSLEEQIIGYHFDTVNFVINYNNELSIIRRKQPDISNKTGDYPLMTSTQAEKKLLEGEYFTRVNWHTPKENEIKGVELIYLTTGFEEYFMPFYKFYVELPGDKSPDDTGLSSFGIYYVPAVESDYLKD